MVTTPVITRVVRRAAAVLAVAMLAGCVFIPPPPPGEPAVAEPAPEPPPAPVLEPAVPDPPPVRPAPAQRRPAVRSVAVLFDAASAEHAAVAAEVAALLGRDGHRVTLVNAGDEGGIAALDNDPGQLAVAVGLQAAQLAQRVLRGPLVFCQIFNHHDLLASARPIWGVDAVPPLRLQLQAWLTLDPSLKRIGMIVGETHIDLAEAAVAAGRELGIDVRYETASSDRETSYLFKRIAPHVDGFWLPPDNRILSPAVLRELLSYAPGHGVRVMVANDALLGWGALLSATGTPDDVASTVRGVVARVASSGGRGLPPMTPLRAVQLDLNVRLAVQLGVGAPPELPWVLRELD